MQRYQILGEIGAGTYGFVLKARHKNGEVVAIKRLKEHFQTWSECVTLREVETLRAVSNHENIVGIKELIREENSQLHFVFEYMPDGNLLQLTKENLSSPDPAVKLTIEKVQIIIRQVLAGLEHMHGRGYFHRDIKPENLLMRGQICKIADFGLSRKYRCNSNTPPLTEYISTRWYRAPEVLLCSPDYGFPIDIFAVGLVMVELLVLRPLFPGTSDLDQLFKIFNLLGRPREGNWVEGMHLMQKMMPCLSSDENFTLQEKYDFDQISSKPIPSHMIKSRRYFQQIMPNVNATTISFIQHLLKLDPKERPTARECLKSDCFKLRPQIISTEKCRETAGYQNSSQRQHGFPIIPSTRNETPLLEVEASSMRKNALQNPHRSIIAHQTTIQSKSVTVMRKETKPFFETHNISQKFAPFQQMPFNPQNCCRSAFTDDYFTNFQNVKYAKGSNAIKPAPIKRIGQVLQNCQDEDINSSSGFGLKKFRHHS